MKNEGGARKIRYGQSKMKKKWKLEFAGCKTYNVQDYFIGIPIQELAIKNEGERDRIAYLYTVC